MARSALTGPRVAGCVAIAAGALCSAQASAADARPSLALEPAPAGDRGFAVERAEVHGHALLSARILLDFAYAPLVLVTDAQARDVVVSHQLWVHALASFSLWHRLALDVDVPFVAAQDGETSASSTSAPRPGAGEAFGDVRLGARIRLFGTNEDARVRSAVAVAAGVWLPTAIGDYAGDGVVRARVAIVGEVQSARLYGAFNSGIRTRPAERLPGALPTHVGTAFSVGLAGGFFADGKRNVMLGTELVADLPLSDGARLFDPRSTVAHLLLTGHYRIRGGPFEIGAAVGPDLAQGAGSASVHGMVLAGYAPERAAPPPDRDGDGIPDKRDACPDLPGVPSGDPVLNGCPAAPLDSDGDGIPDAYDACPRVPGEATADRRTHGCPLPPPGDAPRAALAEQAIVISRQVQFETGTAVLRPESDGVLGDVARLLREHPEIELVEVQGHTDDAGPPELNRALAQERADSVVAWLVARGVRRDRLIAKGYGSDAPLADNATEEGRAKNRRVEIRVLRRRPPEAPREEGPK